MVFPVLHHTYRPSLLDPLAVLMEDSVVEEAVVEDVILEDVRRVHWRALYRRHLPRFIVRFEHDHHDLCRRQPRCYIVW